jgi:integrase
MAVKTQNDYLIALLSIFRFAEREDIIESAKVAEGLRVPSDRVAAKDRRLPFSTEQLQKIFAPENYPSHDKPAKFWIPFVGLFGGMRLGEIVQLRACDVKDVDGFPVIDVNSEDGKRLKTPDSPRLVPIHKQLIRLGFDEFVTARRRRGLKAQLFEELFAAQDPAGAFSKQFAFRLDHLGIRNSRWTFHSLRHGFKSALANASVPADRIDAICGWSGSNRGTASEYGAPPPIKLLAAAINKVKCDLPQ